MSKLTLFRFDHDQEVKPGCCGYRTYTSYWLSDTREHAENEIEDATEHDEEEPSGLCPHCMLDLLDEGDYRIEEAEQ